MRIAARCQHTRLRLSFVCDILPDQSLKIVRAERVKGGKGADDGTGTVVYDGPLSVGPDFRCPCCAVTGIVKCTCKAIACNDGKLAWLKCPSCGQVGKTVTVKEFKVEVGPDRLGGGNPALPSGAEPQRIVANRRHVVVHDPGNKHF